MRLLLLSILLISCAYSAKSQNIQIFNAAGVDVTGTTVNVSFSDTTSASWFYFYNQFKVVNNSGTYKELKANRIELSVMTGAKHALEFCSWHYIPKYFGDYTVFPEAGSPISMDYCAVNAGDTMHLGSEVYPLGVLGTACIRYVVYDGNNPLDSSYVDLCLDIVAGIKEQNQLQVGIYPNPTSDYIFVGIKGDLPFVYTIADVLGNIVLSGEAKHQVDLKCLSSGVYWLNIEAGGKEQFVN
ncbi:MAG: T9SS type A sorting domain-containing protein [Flavobacteriales bacterium]|nr:T9SS type A sorting domain-containing protein [Flavobacteriales bacterium]